MKNSLRPVSRKVDRRRSVMTTALLTPTRGFGGGDNFVLG
jgi:hypothetical protein